MKGRIIHLINVVVALWWGAIYIYIYNIERQGGYIYESNPVMATAELVFSIILVCWFLWQFIWWFKGARYD